MPQLANVEWKDCLRWAKTNQQAAGPSAGYSVEVVDVVKQWGQEPWTEQVREDVGRCLQLQQMAFHANPARAEAGFPDTNDVRGGDPHEVSGSLGTHVTQWLWDPSVDEVSPAAGPALDAAVEAQLRGWRDGSGEGDFNQQPSRWQSQSWHLVRNLDGLIGAG